MPDERSSENRCALCDRVAARLEVEFGALLAPELPIEERAHAMRAFTKWFVRQGLNLSAGSPVPMMEAIAGELSRNGIRVGIGIDAGQLPPGPGDDVVKKGRETWH